MINSRLYGHLHSHASPRPLVPRSDDPTPRMNIMDNSEPVMTHEIEVEVAVDIPNSVWRQAIKMTERNDISLTTVVSRVR